MATAMGSIAYSLSATIAGLTATSDTGEAGDHFRVASQMRDWESRPDSDKDREFTVEYGMVEDALTIGRTTDQLFTGELQIRIGHAKQVSTGSGSTAHKYSTFRRDLDLELIGRKVQDPSNYPSGCCLIVKTGESREDQERHWITTMTFAVTYLGTAIGQ